MSYLLKIALVISIVFAQTAFAENPYLQGYEDGTRDAQNPICLQVVPILCDNLGNLLPQEERVYNGDPRCYADVLESCYEKKQKFSEYQAMIDEKKVRKLKRKLRKLRKNK